VECGSCHPGYLPSKHRALSSNPSAVRKEESVLCVLRTRTGLFQMITGKYNIFSCVGWDLIFFLVVLGLNSGPCTWAAGALSLESRPSPFCFSYFGIRSQVYAGPSRTAIVLRSWDVRREPPWPARCDLSRFVTWVSRVMARNEVFRR
jgi:hypothetical protein